MPVYFIVAKTQNAVKIGKADDPIQRFRALQTASMYDLELLATMPGDLDAEARYHALFEAARIRGEWFDLGRVRKIAQDLNCQPLAVLLKHNRRRSGSGTETRCLIDKIKPSTNRWLYRLRYSYVDPSSGKRKRSKPYPIRYTSLEAEEILRPREAALRVCLSEWYEACGLPFPAAPSAMSSND